MVKFGFSISMIMIQWEWLSPWVLLSIWH